MNQPQNFSNQSDLPSASPVNYKSSYKQPGQASADDSQRNSLLTEADVRLRMDQDLFKSGWYSLFKCWLYTIVLYRLLTLPFGFIKMILSLSSYSPSIILSIIESVFEMALVILLIHVMKHKKLGKATFAFWLAVVNLIYVFCSTWFKIPQIKNFIKSIFPEDDLDLPESQIVFILTFLNLLYPIAAWRIKRNIEKREAILQKTPDIYNL